ncbi:MAG TPA: protein-disulfide reductase DsbD domain-containing protein, partial [Ignavibacteriaceae bacterium]|nr:protein-disulfide reductase DsbD domain-containing protein [Ignavibacteriaceae bacterium]
MYLITITFLISVFSANNIFAQFGGPKDLLKIESYKSLDKISPGGEFKIAAKINIKETWHINSNKPYEDFLIPTEFNIEENPYFKLRKIVYPNPQDVKLAFSDKPLSVLQNEILIGTLVETSDQIKQGEYPLPVVINYQACNDRVCLPP